MTELILPSGFECRALGIFPLPAGLLLLPVSADGEPAMAALLAGDADSPLPPEWSFFAAAAARGDMDAAFAALDALPEPLSSYNRLALGGNSPAPHGVTSPELRVLVAAAEYVHGRRDDPRLEETAELPPEVAATASMVEAAFWLERGEEDGRSRAAEALASAAARVEDRSPLFAAQLGSQRAEILAEAEPQQAVIELRRAIELARESRLPGLRSELYLQLGLLLHSLADGRRGLLLEAVRAYQDALQAGLSAEETPEAYAAVQTHLGLAYLSMPMQDQAGQLRQGVAVQSFRKALEIYRPESHPEAWASTQLNLANALQYLPSSHPQENLVQAVELYEELLEFRNAAKDPLAYARLLANQANALAHLGIFPPALQKLEEARKLFHWHGEPAMAESVLEQVAAIHDQRQRAEE